MSENYPLPYEHFSYWLASSRLACVSPIERDFRPLTPQSIPPICEGKNFVFPKQTAAKNFHSFILVYIYIFLDCMLLLLTYTTRMYCVYVWTGNVQVYSHVNLYSYKSIIRSSLLCIIALIALISFEIEFAFYDITYFLLCGLCYEINENIFRKCTFRIKTQLQEVEFWYFHHVHCNFA